MPKRERDIGFKGFTIKWVGWRHEFGSLSRVGIWIAVHPDVKEHVIYTTTNGGFGIVNQAGYIDMSLKEKGIHLTVLSGQPQFERAKGLAFSTIVEIINSQEREMEKRSGINGQQTKTLQEGPSTD